MKKNLLLSLGLVSVITLAACGESDDNDNNSNSETPAAAEESNDEAENTDDQETDNEDDANSDADEAASDGDWETAVGETIENEGGTFTLVARVDDIDTIESGPMTLDIPQLNVQEVSLSGEILEFLDFEPTGIIQIDMEASNTSEDDINFYPSQATITTNTGEQLESHILLSDHIDGEFLGAVNKSGSIYYLLENSDPNEIETVRILINAPHTLEDWEDVGEKIDMQVTIN
ncbi:hypothetical protein JOC54_002314 [Alkalihalobacillus xiaoxiensis]|uniref:DUF4352 domain-containing protein n=1 Tax=Shouchella xiaoxiensis TaxID=766895 RepID=A0ABS2SU34_9BACI|nr:hypothetical protein [Shouchella xiaoxiensis]MBM7839044.1 hypothetical protein [Shouchella xiaoxiensis]